MRKLLLSFFILFLVCGVAIAQDSWLNLLTSADVDRCDPILGQWSYRTLRCRVYSVSRSL